ncbi:hypothetical protein C8J57DRAFT_1250989 [Mycena rebaudengoi]|nr:hypothetical protein C8J57DRAFT_1250989 [Mycena rebaudengoi]
MPAIDVQSHSSSATMWNQRNSSRSFSTPPAATTSSRPFSTTPRYAHGCPSFQQRALGYEAAVNERAPACRGAVRAEEPVLHVARLDLGARAGSGLVAELRSSVREPTCILTERIILQEITGSAEFEAKDGGCRALG